MTEHLERLWQCPDHIGQAAHFDKRHDLGSKDEHPERSFVLHEYRSVSISDEKPHKAPSHLVAVAHQEVELDTCQNAHN